MPSPGSLRLQKRKQRVDVACDFCRHRKLGCDNARPNCRSCTAHGRECRYTARATKKRPSNLRICQLEEENMRLRQEAEALRSASEQSQIREEQIHVDIPSSKGSVRSGRLSTEESNASTSSIYDQGHNITSNGLDDEKSNKIDNNGSMSAMFDGQYAATREAAPASQMDVSIKTQLLAEAAKQRQLEPINFRSNKLGFADIDPSLGISLLSVFWNRQHAIGSIVYRPSFMRDMACQGTYFSPLLLNSILFHASKHVPGVEGTCDVSDNCNPGRQFRQKAEDLLFSRETQILCKSSIPTIQALLLMSDALFSWCDERSLSWHYLGIATNMIIDLGIHSETSPLMLKKSLSPEDVEIRRRVFWSAFVLDKVQSIYQGRPARLRDMDCSVPMIFLDEYEELELFNSLGYSKVARTLDIPTHSGSTFVHLCRLSTIADRILASLYTEESLRRDNDELYKTSLALHSQLIQWRESSPEHLKIHFDNKTTADTMALPHTLSLILMFYALVILLHRPFVSEGHLSSTTRSPTYDASSLCENAASNIDTMLRRYKEHWCIKSPPYFVSYATYVSATIHVRIAAEKPPAAEAYNRLQNCLEILSEHQRVCRAPRRSMDILIRLIKRLNVDVGGVIIGTHDSSDQSSSPYDSGALGMYSGYQLNVNAFNKAPSISLRSRDNINAVGVAATESIKTLTFHPDLDGSSSTFSNNDSFGQVNAASFPTDNGIDSLFKDINFDFDPLFGFDMDQADFLQDTSF
ncbi:hypothetical protein GGI43DRAFT_416368 [Trichoderma evansii]